MATTVNGYPNNKVDGNPLSAAEVNVLGDGSELHHVNLCELFGPGVIGATDWNLGIVAGQIALTITAGQGIVGDAGERKVCATTATVTIDSDQGLAAGAPTTYYVFKKRDLGTVGDDATGFVAQTSAVAPADSILIGTASMGVAEAASVDNLPAERINLRNPVVLSGLAADRPTFGTAGRFYFATDTNGGTLWHDTGAAWQQVGPGTSETHVLATTAAIGPRHSVSGLTAGMILAAISAVDVAFVNTVGAAINWVMAAAADKFLRGRVTGDTEDRFYVKASGEIGLGPGGVTVPDTIIGRGSAGQLLTTDTALKLVRTSSTTAALSAAVTGESGVRALLRANGSLEFGDGTATPDTILVRGGAAIAQLNSDLHLTVAGKGIRIKEGSNARMGVSTLVGGTVTVANTSITASSRIQLTSQSDGGTPGFLRVSARVNGTSFTILSSSGTDTSVVAWEIKEPA